MKPGKAESVFFILLLAIFLVLGVFYEYFNPILEFNRIAIEQGQWWRIFTAHFVHLNHWHLALNMSGLVLFFYFFYDVMPLRNWLLSLVLGVTGTGVAMFALNPEMNIYVGFSGVLHGIFLVGLIVSFRQTPKLNGLIIFLVFCRLAWEQMPGYDVNYMRDYINGSVFVDAHLYGAVFGLLSATLLMLWNRQLKVPSEEARL